MPVENMLGNVSYKQLIFIIGYFLSCLWWIILKSIYFDSLFFSLLLKYNVLIEYRGNYVLSINQVS